jgi:hypothetical protein
MTDQMSLNTSNTTSATSGADIVDSSGALGFFIVAQSLDIFFHFSHQLLLVILTSHLAHISIVLFDYLTNRGSFVGKKTLKKITKNIFFRTTFHIS